MAGARSETGVTTRVRFAPLEGGNGPFAVFAGNPRDLGDAGYVETELAAAGTATSFAADGDLTGDGRWTVRPDTTADFTTRVLIRRPADPAAFNGTLVVEWFNVTVGMDTGAALVGGRRRDPPGRLRLRRGLGPAGRHHGGQGGHRHGRPGRPGRLRGTDPERYGSLNHPGDAFSYDIFSQIGRTLRGPDSPLTDLAPPAVHRRRSVAVGVPHGDLRQRRAPEGRRLRRLLHPQPGSGGGQARRWREVSEALSGPAVRIRTDVDRARPHHRGRGRPGPVPSATPRPANPMTTTSGSGRWPAPRTPTVTRSAQAMADLIPSPKPINAGPAHYLLASAPATAHQLGDRRRTAGGAARIEIAEDGSVVRDEQGNARGGIRTPPVDVPAATLSGDPVGEEILFQLFGSTTTFEPASTARALRRPRRLPGRLRHVAGPGHRHRMGATRGPR